MKLIVGCDGREPASYFDDLYRLAPLEGTDLLFVHVTDQVLERGWERAAGHHWLRPHPGQRERDRFREAATRSAQEILHGALAATASWPAASRRTLSLMGNPERELVRLALTEEADLIALHHHRLELGPHALGHCARFVVDHAPCAVLVVRGMDTRAAAPRLLGDRLRPHRPPRVPDDLT